MAAIDERNPEQFYHGAKADLRPGELIAPGHRSNYGKRKIAAYVYLTATLDAAIWGAELALGEGPGRIYMVEATGPIEDDPNLTDKKYPGNPTRSYRSRDPLRVTGEVTDWQGHSPEKLKAMRDSVERSSDLALRRSRTELSSLMQQANRADVTETRPDASDFNPAFDRAALKNLRLRKPSHRLIDSPISTDRYIVLTNRFTDETDLWSTPKPIPAPTRRMSLIRST